MRGAAVTTKTEQKRPEAGTAFRVAPIAEPAVKPAAKMSCFGCFGPTKEERAALTIGKVAKGNISREETRKLKAKQVIPATPMKIPGFQPTAAKFEVKDDETALLVKKVGYAVTELRFAEMTSAHLSSSTVKLTVKAKIHTFTAPSAKQARAFYDSIAPFVGKKVMKTK